MQEDGDPGELERLQRGLAHLVQHFDQETPNSLPTTDHTGNLASVSPNTRRYRRRNNVFDPSRAKPRDTLGNSDSSVIVAHLAPRTTEEDVRRTMERFGTVRSCRLIKDVLTGLSKRYAFVEFHHRHDRRAALDAPGTTMMLDGQQVGPWPWW
ncbi:hypothetical protein PAPYR_10167 [Paratrimastix pyriformis]|uniref:RRM domain-containing protein n=1 Tax=Paratrimastix pyriformis TaxID=342808 RepID=A0ABQ8U8B7_9EUKA|nr:hypothetical protein PAPYR_10167 [Paratrimastix pyriformis]